LALGEAAASLQPARVRVAAAKAPNDLGRPGDVANVDFGFLQTDLRDPVVLDDTIVAAQFATPGGASIATLVNWSPHPETLCGDLGEISSDFAHWLRQGMEQGGFTVRGEVQQGLGGTAVYFSGAVGGMMTTLRAQVRGEDGQVEPNCSYDKAQRIGELAAWTALNALRAADFEALTALRVQARDVDIPVDNAFLLALNTLGLFGHRANLGPVTSTAVGPKNNVAPLPYLRAEVDVLTLGDLASPLAQIITVPAELLPEVALGGELAAFPEATPETCFVPNAMKAKWDGNAMERVAAANPDIPQEPAILDHATGEFTFLFGLANDELGYVVPANDFVPATQLALNGEGYDRCGDDDHYEETVSASSVMAPILAQNLTMLLDPSYVPPAQPLLPLGLRQGERGLPTGVWVDSSGSGGFEDREDTQAYFGSPSGAPMAFGFLGSHGEDLGSDPLGLEGQDPRGVWFDTNGSGGYEAGEDAFLMADTWAVNDDGLAKVQEGEVA
jgi:hypothetical protein